jgi:hypothetical protein
MKGPICTILLAALVALPGCSRRVDDEPPVATPEFAVNHTRAPLGSPLEVTYRFRVAADASRFDEDYRVLVHFKDADEQLMWTDDHDPPMPTTRWVPGQVIEYNRTIFVPVYPYIGESVVHMGLYSPRTHRRIPLTGENRGQRSYLVGRLHLLPQSENVFLIYRDGWYDAEASPGNAAVEWQWTKREATISFRNPRRDSLLYLHLDGRPDLFPEPQHVTLRLGTEVLESFAVDSRDPMIRRVPLTEEQLGTADMVELKIEVDKTFVPARTQAAQSSDPRELGVRVFNAYVEPRRRS